MNHFATVRQARYGMPAADQILINRHYVIGYSYYFRQAKWALEIVGDQNDAVERKDVFRSDYRIPSMFRADKVDFQGSGFDRGHLVASDNQIGDALQNSETFLLSNMTPQAPKFNQGVWKALEEKIRELHAMKNIFEVYVVSGPIFYFDQPVLEIGGDDKNDVSIPVPNAYFKSILTENHRGTIKIWSFMLENKPTDAPLETFLVPTYKVEKYAGIELWSALKGRLMDRKKRQIPKLW